MSQQAETSANALRKARDRGCAYLLRQTRPDGGLGPPQRGLADYYKAIAALEACGETAAANRLCQWIRKNGLTSEGDFGPRPAETHGYYYAYYNSWVILGAHRLGQYDLSQRGMDFIMKFYDAASGGFYSSSSERSQNTKQDIWVASGCARAALVTGRLDVACGVGRWLRNVMELQPDYPKRLFAVFSPAGGLQTTPDPAEEIRYVCAQDATRDQYVFNPGIAAGFLCGLHQATGERGWLQLAKEYMRFASGMSDFLWKLLRAGKVGWAASLLYTLSGDEQYARMARRVGDALICSQSDDGSWQQFGIDAANDITAEMVLWLDEIQQAISDESV